MNLSVFSNSRLQAGRGIPLAVLTVATFFASTASRGAPVTDIVWTNPTATVTFTASADPSTNLDNALNALVAGEGIQLVFEGDHPGNTIAPPAPPLNRKALFEKLVVGPGTRMEFFKSAKVLTIFKPEAAVRETFTAPAAEIPRLKTSLDAGVLGASISVTYEGSAVTIVGSRKLAAHVRSTAETLEIPLSSPAIREPMFFPLRYARADQDSTFLREKPLGDKTIGVTVNESAGMVKILKSMLLTDGTTAKEEEPFITSDPTRNGIIIVDYAERRPHYEAIIRKLDVKRMMIEITAAIVDLEVSNGLEWESSFLARGSQKLESREVPFRVGFGADNSFFDTNGSGAITGSPFDKDPPEIPSKLGVGALGLNQTTLIVGSSYAILSNIRALEQRGKAQVLSRPSVLTVDNQPARLTDQTSVVVPVAGERQSYLYRVSSGLDLVVLPRFMPGQQGQKDQVYLGMEVGDGQVDDTALLNPQVATATNDNRVITQAVIRDGESLLVGGRYRNQEIKLESGIPVLSKIPVVGLPFKNKKVTTARFQRLYLITPRIIDPDAAPPPPDDAVLRKLGPELRPEIDPATLRDAQGRIPPQPVIEGVNPVPAKDSFLKRLFKPKPHKDQPHPPTQPATP